MEKKYKLLQDMIILSFLSVPVEDHVGHGKSGGPADPHLAVDQHLAAPRDGGVDKLCPGAKMGRDVTTQRVPQAETLQQAIK